MTMTQVTLMELKNEKTAYELRQLTDEPTVNYEAPMFKITGKECNVGEDFQNTKYLGLTYGGCYPTVDKGIACPPAPTGSPTPVQGDASTDGKKMRCELPCKSDADCGAEYSRCAAKSSSKLFDMQLQDDISNGVCLYLNQETHHNFDSPYGSDKDILQCTETSVGDGVDAVEFTTTTGKAGICAPRAQDGKCISSDYPPDSGPVVKAIKDESGAETHCQLTCKADNECMEEEGAKCTSTNAGDMMCLFPSGTAPGPGKHQFESPYTKKKCTEADVDVVEFETSDGKTAGICAPKSPQTGTCSADDHPGSSTALPKSIKDANGSHCELDCSADQTCPGDSKCTSVKTVKSQLFAMRLEDGGDCKICLYSKTKKALLIS